jgi:hypothetical protein
MFSRGSSIGCRPYLMKQMSLVRIFPLLSLCRHVKKKKKNAINQKRKEKKRKEKHIGVTESIGEMRSSLFPFEMERNRLVQYMRTK